MSKRTDATREQGECVWVKDTDGCYMTGCAEDRGAYLAFDGPLDECGVKFCQRCGGQVRESK